MPDEYDQIEQVSNRIMTCYAIGLALGLLGLGQSMSGVFLIHPVLCAGASAMSIGFAIVGIVHRRELREAALRAQADAPTKEGAD